MRRPRLAHPVIVSAAFPTTADELRPGWSRGGIPTSPSLLIDKHWPLTSPNGTSGRSAEPPACSLCPRRRAAATSGVTSLIQPRRPTRTRPGTSACPWRDGSSAPRWRGASRRARSVLEPAASRRCRAVAQGPPWSTTQARPGYHPPIHAELGRSPSTISGRSAATSAAPVITGRSARTAKRWPADLGLDRANWPTTTTCGTSCNPNWCSGGARSRSATHSRSSSPARPRGTWCTRGISEMVRHGGRMCKWLVDWRSAVSSMT